MQYKGLRWFKCDLHLHTPASKCFLDKSVTPVQWVQAAKESKLDCVAVTDHNTGEWIDQIKAECEKEGIVLFPGVEITCDSSKVHLLVLFDRDKDSQYINDFLIECGISRDKFADAGAHSEKTIFEITELANKKYGVVIPAHIDEYNGVGYCCSNDTVKNFFDQKKTNINAAQIVHKQFLGDECIINEELVREISQEYNICEHQLGIDDLKNAYNGIRNAKNNKVKLLTFSDNPDSTKPSKHGVSGIGKNYSWIKMDENPSLESLRQAFIISDRTRNCFEDVNSPYQEPSLWIKSITIDNTCLTERIPFKAEFSPQLTTIIGGRGSGKSSILRFLRGSFGKNSELADLNDIKKDQNDFFKKVDNEKKGVLKDDSIIEVEFIRNGIEYKVVYQQNKDPKINIQKYNSETSEYEDYNKEGFLELLDFEQYSQKQIYSIAQEPNALLRRIDSASEILVQLSNELRQKRTSYSAKMASIRDAEQFISQKGKIETKIEELNGQIELLRKSGVADDIKTQEAYTLQKQYISEFIDATKKNVEVIRSTLSQLVVLKNFDESKINESFRGEIGDICRPLYEKMEEVKLLINNKSLELFSIIESARTSLDTTSLFQNAKAFNEEFNKKKIELEKKGIADFSNFEKYSLDLKENKDELDKIKAKEQECTGLNIEKDSVLKEIKQIRERISEERNSFIKQLNTDKTIISLSSYRNKKDFESQFRAILQRPTKYEKSIDKLRDYILKGNPLEKLAEVKTAIHAIIEQKENALAAQLDGTFKNMIRELTPDQIDNIDLLYPEDDVILKIKRQDMSPQPISTASAGQKTTAILSFILSFGTKPLILDQPEDDLDNRLVYDLIVEKLREIKKKRQVIVVTHNPNIPVNGDAEYIISMQSSTNLQSEIHGTIDKSNVKKEICEIMEGGIEAFRIRAQRYESYSN